MKLRNEVMIPDKTVLDYSWVEENSIIESILFESTFDTSDDCMPTFVNCKGLKRFAVLDDKSPFFTRDGVLYMHLEKNPTKNMFSRMDNFSWITSGVALVAVPPCYPHKRFVMPDDVVLVAISAFGGCNNIEEIVVSDSIQGIDAYMFGGLEDENPFSLKKLFVPDKKFEIDLNGNDFFDRIPAYSKVTQQELTIVDYRAPDYYYLPDA